MKNYLNQPGCSIFAHRGGSLESYENTLEAFQYALDLGSHYIETDVQLSKDGKVYIFHDDSLKRVAGIDKNFSDLNSHEIESIKIFGKQPIPLLEETLKTFPNTNFNIDLKTDLVAEPALEILKKHNAQDRVCIASFSDNRINLAREFIPTICTSMGPNQILEMRLAAWKLIRPKIVSDCVQIPIYKYGIKLATKTMVDYCHAHNLKVHVWTINDAETMKKLINIGVDGIITDRPKLLKDVLNSVDNS
ncbi:MAG: glycerophosphodiester phosphodiesterase [Gammaproteobacteria bacterium]